MTSPEKKEIVAQQEHTKPEEKGSSRRRFLKLMTWGIGASALELTGCKAKRTENAAQHNYIQTSLGESLTPEPKRTEQISSLTRKSEAAEIINSATFEKGSFDEMAKMFGQIFSDEFGYAYYFTLQGKLSSKQKLPQKGQVVKIGRRYVKAPESWELASSSGFWTNNRKQLWHNQNRKRINPKEGMVLPKHISKMGYPFVAVPNSDYAELKGNSMEKIVRKRLENKHQDRRYFNGEQTSLDTAIDLITTAYGVPSHIAKGIGAQESNFFKFRKSNCGAEGIFQLMKGKGSSSDIAFNKLLKNPSFRKGKLNLNKDFYNRFVQIELFCAYYNYIKAQLSPSIQTLNTRIKEIDPSYQGVKESAIISAAYNAGNSKIRNCINDFISLTNEELIKKLGKPPYDSNIVLGILSNSFGKNRVGAHVLFYATKIEGWRNLLKEPKDLLAEEDSNDLVGSTKKELNEYYERLRHAVRDSDRRFKIGYYLKSEKEKIQNPENSTSKQIQMLEPQFRDVFDKVLKDHKIVPQWDLKRKRKKMLNKCEKRKSCIPNMAKAQDDWKNKAINNGKLIPLDRANQDLPYFCSNIERKNRLIGKEWSEILEALVELVNHQINIFNEDPESFGYPHLNGIIIPHIDALQISDAFWHFDGNTAADFSAHMLGQAIDIGEIVRFKDSFEYEGKERIPKGGYIKENYKDGFGELFRRLISMMVGRSLLSMREIMGNKGVEFKPYWKNSSKTWHIAIGKK